MWRACKSNKGGQSKYFCGTNAVLEYRVAMECSLRFNTKGTVIIHVLVACVYMLDPLSQQVMVTKSQKLYKRFFRTASHPKIIFFAY